MDKKRRRSPQEILTAALLKDKQRQARLNDLKMRVRKTEERLRTRELILCGAAAVVEMKANPEFAALFKVVLNKHTVREHDRTALTEYLK